MIQNRKLLGSAALLLIASVMLASCQLLPDTEPAEEIAETAAVETLAAIQTQTAVAEIAQEGTQVAQTQTAIAEVPTPTDTTVPSPEPSPTPTEDPEICNWGRFVADVSIDDSTVFDLNESFTKIWRLENIGTCTWNTNYQVVFSGGYQMGAPSSFNLPEVVQPGETVDIAINMVAPSSPGTYTGYWLLMSDTGEVFGLGTDGDAPFWIRIKVTEDDEFVVYNLAENYCDAGWESSVVDPIACPSEEDIENGFVQAIDTPRLENGNYYDEPAILAYPDFGESGYMVGRYPPLLIEDGDHFRATIGCLHGAENCSVNFTLRVLTPGEGFTTLGMWREVYDGQIFPIDVDLSDYAGMEVELTLSTIAVDDGTSNYAIWVDPRVVREAD